LHSGRFRKKYTSLRNRDSGLGTRDSKNLLGSRIVNPESRYLAASAAIAATIVASRFLFRIASPADWFEAPIFSGAAYASPLLRP